MPNPFCAKTAWFPSQGRNVSFGALPSWQGPGGTRLSSHPIPSVVPANGRPPSPNDHRFRPGILGVSLEAGPPRHSASGNDPKPVGRVQHVAVVVKTYGIPYFSGWIESEVHWGYDLAFDPWPCHNVAKGRLVELSRSFGRRMRELFEQHSHRRMLRHMRYCT